MGAERLERERARSRAFDHWGGGVPRNGVLADLDGALNITSKGPDAEIGFHRRRGRGGRRCSMDRGATLIFDSWPQRRCWRAVVRQAPRGALLLRRRATGGAPLA